MCAYSDASGLRLAIHVLIDVVLHSVQIDAGFIYSLNRVLYVCWGRAHCS